MKSLTPWYRVPQILSSVGLKLRVVRRYGKQAEWIRCRCCGSDIVAISCTDCGWDLERHLLVAAAHVKALAGAPEGLGIFRCGQGCNDSLCDGFPKKVTQAQAEQFSQELVDAGKRRVRRARMSS
jgi:hypothetical protein